MLCNEFFKYQDQIKKNGNKKNRSYWAASKEILFTQANCMNIKHLNVELKDSE
ncbi:hypothetical protein VP01_875g4 [Puccinia sorghi]|uniref:Uncharacterized protein n=1 Tax=Puccinia sorghi TaxID=27349 RepID=A0A0L6U8J6_9BASI|nr:hypothetical protein VP01_875g4 [Puccinia sorghi]